MRRLMSVFCALVFETMAFVGDPRRFPSGRHLASYLGLTPREYSSGSTRRLGRISKRGNAGCDAGQADGKETGRRHA
jgi:transposase